MGRFISVYEVHAGEDRAMRLVFQISQSIEVKSPPMSGFTTEYEREQA